MMKKNIPASSGVILITPSEQHFLKYSNMCSRASGKIFQLAYRRANQWFEIQMKVTEQQFL